MKFIIYQAIKGNFNAEDISEKEYKKVAIVEALDLDDAYKKTQNTDKSWTKNFGVEPLQERCRSTSIGDIIHDIENDISYMVKQCGFEEKNILDLL